MEVEVEVEVEAEVEAEAEAEAEAEHVRAHASRACSCCLVTGGAVGRALAVGRLHSRSASKHPVTYCQDRPSTSSVTSSGQSAEARKWFTMPG